MSANTKLFTLAIFGCLYTVALVFLYLYIFGEDIMGKFSECKGDKIMVPCGALGDYFRKASLQSGEKLFITIEIKRKPQQQNITIILPNQNSTVERNRQYVIKRILPNKTYCGQQHWDEYYHLENETSGYEAHVYEFPWLVSLVNKEYRCSGFLISVRYFITTKECFHHGYEVSDEPNVLVGVHDIEKTISCILLPYAKDCTTGSKQLRIIYGFKINSLVLVKVDKGVAFNYFVRPICLPLDDHSRPEIGNTVYISGWGRLLENEKYVSIKKRNRQKVIGLNDSSCKAEDINSKNWLCTLPLQDNTTACYGDDGSPTMYMYQGNWFAGGVVVPGSTCDFNRPIYSITMSVDVVNSILDIIYNEDCKSPQSCKNR